MSLVADYSGSDSDSSEEESKVLVQRQTKRNTSQNNGLQDNNTDGNEENKKTKCEFQVTSKNMDNSHKKAKQFFTISDNEEEEEEDDQDDEDYDTFASQSQNLRKTELQNPFRNFGSGDVEKSDSVFQIPFLEQEVEKSAALERHVKMTHRAGSQDMINGKKVCWNYRRGKCRFGHNCTFAHDEIAHDSDNQPGEKTVNITPPVAPTGQETASDDASTEYDESVVVSSVHLSKHSSSKTTGKQQLNSEFDSSPERERTHSNIGKKGKKRVGLSQSLTPGKKVMKMYYKNI